MKKIVLLILALVFFGAGAVQAEVPQSNASKRITMSNAERKAALRKRVAQQKQALAEKQEKIRKEEEEARLRAEEEARLAAEQAAIEAGALKSADVIVLPTNSDVDAASKEIEETAEKADVKVETTEDIENALKSLQEDLKRLQESQDSL